MHPHTDMTWADMSEILYMKTRYGELVDDNLINVPKNRKQLTTASAQWFVENGLKFNVPNEATNEAYDICANYFLVSTYKFNIGDNDGTPA